MKFSISLCCLVISILVLSRSNKSVLGDEAVNDVSCQNPNFIVISTIDGILTALDANTGKNCWSVVLNAEKFLSSSLSQLKIYENGREVSLVPSLDGGLYKYDESSKVIVPLPFNVDSLINRPFFFDSSTSIIGGKIKHLYGINSLTGEIIYVCKGQSCNSFISSFPAHILVIEEISQFANAIDSSKAEQKWYFRVSDLTVKLASQSSSFNPFKDDIQKNAVIPRNYQDFLNIDTSLYKISLEKGYAGMLNKTTHDFSWSFKSSSPITDVWYIKDNIVKSIDPFDSESGFFSIDDGQHFAFLFLGSFENQLFIKRSRNFSLKETSSEENALSNVIFYDFKVIPICSKSENSVVLGSSLRREDLNSSLRFNVTDYGTYFYINYTVFENKTHCVVNSSFTFIQQSSYFSNQILVIYVFCSIGAILFILSLFPGLLNSGNKDDNKTKQSLDSELSSSDNYKEFHSRFDQDFEYLSTLGTGGFGIVMAVKNKIDDCQYAVKRICLHERLNKTQYERVLREVKALAKLDHHGIVRYFNAWTEYPPMGWQEEKDEEYAIICLMNRECDSRTFSVMRVASTEKSASIPIPEERHVELVPRDIFRHKLIQNPLAVPEDELWNVDSELSLAISSENQDRNSDSFFTTYDEISESDQITSNEDSSEETSHDSQFYQNMEESNDSFSVVFEDPNLSQPHEDNVLADLRQRTSVHISETGTRQLETARAFEDPNLSQPHEDNVLDLRQSTSVHISETGTRQLETARAFEDPNLSQPHEDNVLADLRQRTSVHISETGTRQLETARAFEDPNLSQPHEDNVLADLRQRTSVHISETGTRQLETARAPILPFELKSKVSANSSKDTPRGYLYIQMQLCQKDSLRDWLDFHSEYRDYDKVMHIFSEIVEAVHYVHNCGLMHRDLKPSNIYFSLEGAIKIGDFGLATSSEICDNNTNNSIQSYSHTSDIGTELYMSPEQKMKDYDFKTDIYSLGIILFELLVPFKTVTERFKALLAARELRFPENFTSQFVKESKLLKKLLHKDPAKRPTTGEIKRSLILIKGPSDEAP